jgi:V/A-type H+-transporting ATPase subunit B
LKYAKEYSNELLAIDVNVEIETMLNTTWRLFSTHFTKDEVGIKQELTEKYWLQTEIAS